MRTLVAGLLVLALICASFIITALSVLSNLTQDVVQSGVVSMDALMVGKAHHLFLTPLMWENYPALPSLFILIDWTALLLTIAFVAIGVWLFRLRLQKSWLFVSITPLAAAPILYGIGFLALHGNTVPEQCGPWLVTMLLGLLYPLLAFCVFLFLQLTPVSSLRAKVILTAPSSV